MLSRRLMLAGPALVGLSRKAAAQYRREDADTDIVLLSADGQAAAVQAVNDVVARIRTPDVSLRAEAGPDILDAASRLVDRPAAVAAMLPSVSLVYMMQAGLPEHVVYANRFIGRMGVSELHVLASRRVSDVRDLTGQQVAVGPKGSSTQATAAIWLERSSLRVKPLYLEPEQALAAVRHGQIPAMMLLAAKPARLFFDLNRSEGVHFLPVGVPDGKPVGLFPTQILPTDYPLLAGGEAGTGQPVATLGVPMVLACYAWSPLTPICLGLARLTDLLIQRGSGLRGFDMAADVAGWQRFPPVTAWLARGGTVMDAVLAQRRSPSMDPIDTSQAAPPEPRRPPAGTGRSASEKERLFQQFLDWHRHQ
ncbi:MAG: TAXI family TRAP transporter solute-binding subunit [Rhodopila sp.]